MPQQSRFTTYEQQTIREFADHCEFVGAIGFEIHPSEVRMHKALIEKLENFGYITQIEFTGSLPGFAKGSVYGLTEAGVEWLAKAGMIRQFTADELATMTEKGRQAQKGIKVAADDFYTYWAC